MKYISNLIYNKCLDFLYLPYSYIEFTLSRVLGTMDVKIRYSLTIVLHVMVGKDVVKMSQ